MFHFDVSMYTVFVWGVAAQPTHLVGTLRLHPAHWLRRAFLSSVFFSLFLVFFSLYSFSFARGGLCYRYTMPHARHTIVRMACSESRQGSTQESHHSRTEYALIEVGGGGGGGERSRSSGDADLPNDWEMRTQCEVSSTIKSASVASDVLLQLHMAGTAQGSSLKWAQLLDSFTDCRP